MRPDPFLPEALGEDDRFVRDLTTDHQWHRVFHRPLYADTDRSQVVYHANYLRYFELGRASLMRDIGYPYKDVEDSGFVYPIIDLGVTFYHPLYYDDPMWIHTRPDKLERIKVRFDYVVTHADTGVIVCKGYTQHCAITPQGLPCPVDERTVKLWKSFPNPQ